jgi:hypothetical protein
LALLSENKNQHVCRSTPDSRYGFSVFGCSPRLKFGQLWRIFLDVVVPAWSAGTQVTWMFPDASLRTWMPAVHAGMTDAMP